MQTRCKTIRSATEAYNRAARALDPPRPSLDWAQVSRYSFIEEFSLLHDTRRDISKAPWADPVVRETIKRFFRVRRAHEEIQRCNIEIRRIFTSIHDETDQHSDILKALADQKNPIFGAVHDYSTRRRRVNTLLLERIQQVFDLDGFTGDRTLGRRKGSQVIREDEIPGRYDHAEGDDAEGEDVDEIEHDQVNGVTNASFAHQDFTNLSKRSRHKEEEGTTSIPQD